MHRLFEGMGFRQGWVLKHCLFGGNRHGQGWVWKHFLAGTGSDKVGFGNTFWREPSLTWLGLQTSTFWREQAKNKLMFAYSWPRLSSSPDGGRPPCGPPMIPTPASPASRKSPPPPRQLASTHPASGTVIRALGPFHESLYTT